MDAGNATPKQSRFRRFFDFQTIKQFLDTSDYTLPLEAWNATTHVLFSILAASFAINILSLAFPLALLQVYDRIIPNAAVSTLVLLVVGVGIALILEAICRVARAYVGAWADAKFEHITGCRAYRTLIESSLLDFEREGSGIHLKRMNALSMLREYYAGQALISIADIPFIIILLGLIAYIGGWVVFVPIGILIVFVSVTLYEAKQLHHLLKSRNDHDERRFNFIIETLGNIHTVKAVTMEAQMLRRYERLQKVSAVHDYDISMKGSTAMVMGVSVAQATVILVVAFGSMMVVAGHLTIGGLAACTLLSGRSLAPVNLIVGLWTRLQTIKIAKDELDEVLNMPRECPLSLPNMPKIKGDIEFEQVTFRYKPNAPKVLDDVSFKIPAKAVVGLTGRGLSGKSTLNWLLLAMFYPEKGRVLLDGMPTNEFQAESIRRQIAYMPQKAQLYKGTIMENLTMFNETEHYDYAKKIAEVLGLSEIIEQLPKGYDTMVGDQAIESLSRGINQRIAIARALVMKPSIILFDEANTAMDMHGDIILRNILKQLAGQRTMIIVTHRPSLLELAETVYSLEAGKVTKIR